MPLQAQMAGALQQMSRAYRECPLQQLRLLSQEQFISYLKDRNLNFTLDDLQRHADSVPAITESGVPHYHPYQVWAIHSIVKAATPNIAWQSCLTSTEQSFGKLMGEHQNQLKTTFAGLEKTAVEFHQVLALLAQADPFCVPKARRQLRLPSGIDTSAYVAWRKDFNSGALLSKSGITVQVLEKWHRALSIGATSLDDAERWYPLICRVHFRKIGRLKGSLRLALDFYEIAVCIRVLSNDLGVSLPAEDEYASDGGWKVKAYGERDIRFGSRLTLKRIAREYGLDASFRLWWYVEGPTEVGFISAFSDETGVDIEELGIAVVNLGGTGDLTARRKELGGRLRGARSLVETLRKAKYDEEFVFVTADTDQGVAEGIESFRLQGLLTAGFRRWTGDFEEANFSLSELTEVLKRMTGVATIEVTSDEIAAEREKRSTDGSAKAFGEAFEAIARRKSGLEDFGKSEEWGKALGRYAAEHPEMGSSPRPVVQAWQHAIYAVDCDFDGSLQHLVCDVSGKMVPLM